MLGAMVKRAELGEEARTQTLHQGRRPAPLAAIVSVTAGEAKPEEFRLQQGECIVGSSREADIVIGVTTVSRRHVKLSLMPEGVLVEDLGSRNGTYYNGQRVERMVLSVGGELTVGPATIRVSLDTGALERAVASDEVQYHGMFGTSQAMRSLFAILRRLEGSLVPVLIEGESGVGKERVARALHESSAAAAGPFVVVNCGALARELVGSELFGHRRGAFSGAHESRKGAFRSADGGTLFLDEVGELPLEIQPTLLRAIELGEVRPLGEDQATRVKVRVVTATNRDLESEVSAGNFRRDLFYRLAVVRLTVAPLRDRPEDIELLARRFGSELGMPELPSEVVRDLTERPWPGNVRELKNAVQAYSALGDLPERPRVDAKSLHQTLAPLVDTTRPYVQQKEALTDAFTTLYLTALLASTGGNQSEAARVSGMHRNHLARLLAKHGITPGARGE